MKSIKYIKICIQHLGLSKGLEFWFKNRNENFQNVINHLEAQQDQSEIYDEYETLHEFALELQFYHQDRVKSKLNNENC